MKTLSEEMDALATVSVTETAHGEARFQKLYLLMPDDTLTLAALNVGPGRNIAYTARLLVYQHQPAMAVLESEGWTVGWDVPHTDPLYEQVKSGKLAPSDLPPDKRGEALTMYGETPDGEIVGKMWKILPDGEGKRRIEPLDAAMQYAARWTPLYVVEDLERLIDGQLSLGEVQRRSTMRQIEPLMDHKTIVKMREVVAALSRAERHEILRRVVGETMFTESAQANLTGMSVPSEDRKN